MYNYSQRFKGIMKHFLVALMSLPPSSGSQVISDNNFFLGTFIRFQYGSVLIKTLTLSLLL